MTAAEVTAPARTRSAAFARAGATMAAVLILDQVTKHTVASGIAPGEQKKFLPLVDLVHVRNNGVAFGFLSGGGALVLGRQRQGRKNQLTLATAATATVTGDALSVITTPAVGRTAWCPFGNENPFNDVLVQEPALGSSNGIAELEELAGARSGQAERSAIERGALPRAPNLAGGSKVDNNGLNFVAAPSTGHLDALDQGEGHRGFALGVRDQRPRRRRSSFSIYTDSLTCTSVA